MNARAPGGFKKTEVGIIPTEWEVKELRRISPSQTVGLVINPSSYFDEKGSVPMLVGSNVSDNGIDWASSEKITDASNRSLPSSRVYTGDLVVVRVGEPGTAAVIPKEIDGCNCASMMIIRRHESYCSNWLCFMLNSRIGRSQVETVQYGTAQKQFNIGDAVDFKFPVPKLHEQRAIAAVLSGIDTLISGLDQLIAKKRDIKQATMQQLLTGQTRLPGFSGEWEKLRLETICAFITKGSTPTTYGFGWESSGILFLRSECVAEQGLDLSQSMFISDAAHNTLRRSEICGGDLLITITGNVGRVILLSDGFPTANINQHIARIRVISPEVDSRFVYHFLSVPDVRKKYNSITTGQAYPQISLKQVRETEIRLPALAEQVAIAQILSDMDTELATLESRRDKAKQLKQGMMQELLTGRIRFHHE